MIYGCMTVMALDRRSNSGVIYERKFYDENTEGHGMNEWDRLHRQAQRYKESHPKGTRIKLLSMGNDPNSVESGTRGTVITVDDVGTLHCHFDNGRQLGIVPGEDSFRKLTTEELAEEQASGIDEDEIGPAIGMRAVYGNKT